jgi:hypothetical protein
LKSTVAVSVALPADADPNHTDAAADTVLAVDVKVAHAPLALWNRPASDVTFVTAPPHPRVKTDTAFDVSVIDTTDARDTPDDDTDVAKSDTENDAAGDTPGQISVMLCGPEKLAPKYQ